MDKFGISLNRINGEALFFLSNFDKKKTFGEKIIIYNGKFISLPIPLSKEGSTDREREEM